MKKIKETFYHASENKALTLDDIDFTTNKGSEYARGLAVTKKDNTTEKEWSKRTCLYELVVEGKVLDLRNEETAFEFGGTSDLSEGVDAAVKKYHIDIVYLTNSVQVITNKDAVKSFKKVK